MVYNPGPVNGFSQSQVSSFLRCRFRWGLENLDNLIPRTVRAPLALGSLVHKGLEAALKAYVTDEGNPVDKVIEEAISQEYEEYIEAHELFDEEIPALAELSAKAVEIAKRAYVEFIRDFEPLSINGVPAIEFRVTKPLEGNPVYDHFHGTLDVVAMERHTKHNWLVDFKVRKSFQPVENEEVNIQMSGYQHVLFTEYGVKTVGSISFQIHNELPSQPKQNKDGSFSKAACKTDWPTYLKALEDAWNAWEEANPTATAEQVEAAWAKLNPENYADMRSKLADTEFFRQSRAYRKPEELQQTWEQVIVPTAYMMATQRDQLVRALNPMACNGCAFRMLCLEGLRGGDVEYIKSTDFTQRNVEEDEQEKED